MKAWLAWQLRQLADVLALPTVSAVHFVISNAPPSRISDGDLVYADGTNWNPGAGAGLYERRTGAWVKL
jgi:hypothetical protein